MEAFYRSCKPYIDNLPNIDKQFAALLADSPHTNEIKQFITRFYLPVAYFHAYQRLKKRLYNERERLIEEASDLALETVEDILSMVEEGRFGFSGKVRFSTYLIGALATAIKPKNYIPDYIVSLGDKAVRLFYLIFIDYFDNKTAVEVVSNEFSASSDDIEAVLRRMYEVLKTKPIYKRFSLTQKPVQLDDFEPEIKDELLPIHEDPENDFLAVLIKEKTAKILYELTPIDRKILQRLFFSQAPPKQRDLAEELELKSIQYRITQAKNNFLDRAREEKLLDLYSLYREKVKSYV